MGLFDFLFGGKKRSNVEVVPDHIWMTTAAKFAGLTKEAIDRSRSETVAVLLVAHFPDVLERLEKIANHQAWDVPCKAVPASNLNANLAASLRVDESATIDIIVGERHPLPSVDNRLEEFADELPCRGRFSHHVSLDDAMMKVFGGDWVKTVLKQLGMTEDEAIESQIVSRRIRQAQQKIEGRTFGSLDAESASEWLQKNCPDLFPK
jgi:preprotein translocase subunit SecA